jgi:hypothetical protein
VHFALCQLFLPCFPGQSSLQSEARPGDRLISLIVAVPYATLVTKCCPAALFSPVPGKNLLFGDCRSREITPSRNIELLREDDRFEALGAGGRHTPVPSFFVPSRVAIRLDETLPISATIYITTSPYGAFHCPVKEKSSIKVTPALSSFGTLSSHTPCTYVIYDAGPHPPDA